MEIIIAFFTKHFMTCLVYIAEIKLIIEVHIKEEAHLKSGTVGRWNQKNCHTTWSFYYRKPEAIEDLNGQIEVEKKKYDCMPAGQRNSQQAPFT